jgi:regulator of sigma E protease
VVQTYEVSRQTLVAVGQMIVGARGTDDLGGPLGIGKIAGDAAKLGLASLVTFMAILSVNLALINLFPIPILDGGHLVFYAFEAIRGRPLPPRAQELGFRAGFALLITLFVFATWNDLSNLGFLRWAAGLFG